MRIYVRFGHEILTSGLCTAATGILSEYNIISEYAAQLAYDLSRAGHTVHTGGHTDKVYANKTDALYAAVNEAKAWNADLFISCHANAGGGTGPEVYYRTGDSTAQSLATRISSDIASLLGLTNRGAKDGNTYNLYEVKSTTFSIPSIIIEPFFIDRQNDCDQYNRVGGTQLGDTIANSVLSVI